MYLRHSARVFSPDIIVIVTSVNILLWLQAHRNIGYCAQNNAMLDHLTCKETLTMYARIGGIPEENIGNEVDSLLRLLLMEHCADKMVDTLRYSSLLNMNICCSPIRLIHEFSIL